ncbi:MAG: hypothetical protein ACR2K5_01740 [Pseudolabrys sp.]
MMKKIFCAGALALFCLMPAISTYARAAELSAATEFTKVDVSRIRTALKLTSAQQAYWPPIENALRSLSREQPEPEGFVRRISHRVVSVALNGAAVARLADAARPLVRVLDDEQRQVAISLAREMGLGPMLAAL